MDIKKKDALIFFIISVSDLVFVTITAPYFVLAQIIRPGGIILFILICVIFSAVSFFSYFQWEDKKEIENDSENEKNKPD